MALRTTALALALSLAPVGCGAPAEHVAGPGPDALDAPWLQGSATITPAHLARELSLGAGNPEVAALVREAVARLGGGQMAGLAAAFWPCPASVSTEGGLTVVKSSDVWVARTVEELAFGTRPPAAARDLAALQEGRFRDLRVTETADFILVERTTLPQICVLPGLSVVEAYETIVHELVHAVRLDPRTGSRLAETAPDEPQFLAAFVLVPGGEVDAYTASTRARLRLQPRASLTSPLLPLFDLGSGEPRFPPPALAQVVLAPQPAGLGYASGLLLHTFAESRDRVRAKLDEQRKLLDAVLASRRADQAVFVANLAVHAHNIAAHEHNLGVAGSRGDQALAERSRAGIADATREMARTRALLAAARASEPRLVEDLALVDRRREALGAPPPGAP